MAKTSKRIKSTKVFNNGLSFNDKKAIKLAKMVKGLTEEELLQCGKTINAEDHQWRILKSYDSDL